MPFKVLPNPQILFTASYLGAMVASFPLISALAHFLIAYPKNKDYVENLKKGMNPYRWYEYAFSSSIMIVLIATFVGVWDFWSLVMIFVLNAMMIMFGYLMELINQSTEKTNWTPFILGCISGSPMDCNVRVFCFSNHFYGHESACICLRNFLRMLHCFQHLRFKHGSSIQRRWTMERLLIRRKSLHYSKPSG